MHNNFLFTRFIRNNKFSVRLQRLKSVVLYVECNELTLAWIVGGPGRRGKAKQ